MSPAQRHNLPAPHTHLIGREQDSGTVRDLVLQVPGRLVTLTGTGGCGKTQLALLVAAGLVDEFRDGAWLVELAPVQAAHLVPYAVAAVAALAQGDLATARGLSLESLNLQGSAFMRTGTLYILGQIAIVDSKYTEARQHLFQALALLETSDDPVATTQVVEALGHLASRVGRSDVALRLAAAAQAARDTLGVVIARSLPGLYASADSRPVFRHAERPFPLSRDLRDRWLVPFRKTVRAEDADRWWAEGHALSLTDAVALAESELPARGACRRR